MSLVFSSSQISPRIEKAGGISNLHLQILGQGVEWLEAEQPWLLTLKLPDSLHSLPQPLPNNVCAKIDHNIKTILERFSD